MIIHVTKVEVVGPYSLDLTFDNGIRKRVNLLHELYGEVFQPLRDPACFAQAYLDPDSRTVTWPRISCPRWSRKRGQQNRPTPEM